MITKAVVSRPVLWLVVFSLISITAVFLIPRIAVDMFPEIELPFLIISTSYPGADPETVENSVTSVLEAAVANTSGITELTSVSRSQNSLIQMVFDFGTDIESKKNSLRDSLDRVRNALPDNASTPMIIQFDPNAQPIMRIAVRGNPGSGLNQNDLRAIAINDLEDRFKQIEGVASTSVEGGQDTIVQVNLFQNRLEAYGITINEIARTLSSQNMNLGAGFIEEGLIEYSIKTSGEFLSINEIANTVVLQSGGADIRLQDIGTVDFAYREERSSVFINGDHGVYISIMKESGANTVNVANQIYRQFDIIARTTPYNITLEITQDSTVQTRAMLEELVQSIAIGIALAMLVLVLFLRNRNASIIVGLAIPISFAVTLLVMAFANITLNMLTLAGLILGLGMTVDCSIVVIESITAYREKGEKLTLAAILAGNEVMSSLIAGTLTTLCVFIPIIIFQNALGMIGILLINMVITICVSLIASLFIGIFLVPVLASKWLPVHSRLQKPLRNRFISKIDSGINFGITAVTLSYKKILANALQHRLITIILVLCSFAGSVIAMGRIDFTMMPEQTSDTVTVNIEMPLGTKYDDTKAVALELQEFVLSHINGFKNVITTAGSSGGGMMGGSSGINTASVNITLDLNNPNADKEDSAKEKLRAHFANFPNATISFAASGMGGMMGGSDIDIVLRTGDIREGIATAETIRRLLEINVPEVQDIAIDVSEGLPQIDVRIDRARAYNMGLNITSIASEISAAMNGVTATSFRQGGNEFNVVLQLASEDRYELPDLGRIFVRSNTGMLFPVSNFANFERTYAPVNINRDSQTRTIHITAGVMEGYSIRAVEAKIANILAENDINAIFAGVQAETQEMLQTFVIIIVLALVLVFGVMAAQYESFKDPFINFCTIPLLLIGVVLIHAITNKPISMLSMMGIVLLAGLVTNNGILLVDYTNQLVRKGMGVMEACLEAGAVRFRAIIMSALTTMLALVPMAFFPGESSMLTSPIGLTVFGGLISATVISLVFTPVLYSLFHKNKLEIVKEYNND